MNKIMTKKYRSAVDFFVDAPESERLAVFREAAMGAMRDQRATVRKAELIRRAKKNK